MVLLDEEISTASALIIDGNATSRSMLSAQLRDLGLNQVRQCTRIKDARLLLEAEHFDIVLCDYHFEHSEISGQDLLDELRREQLLPHKTVFLMITGQATYATVTEAAESALDGYIVKPYTSASLAEKLASARQRKRELGAIFNAMERKNYDLAAKLCMLRFQQRELYWQYSARIGAELLIRQDKLDDARRLYGAMIEAKPLPWARIGLARVDVAKGDYAAARRTMEALLQDDAEQADAHDVMSRVQMELGELTPALQAARQACSLTPGCLLRQQHLGALSFYCRQHPQAREQLERALAQGLRSKLFDWWTLGLVALLRYDARDSKLLRYAQEALTRLRQTHGDDARLLRLDLLMCALRALLEQRKDVAADQAAQLCAMTQGDELDLEGACMLLALQVRMQRQQLPLQGFEAHLPKLALRCCSAKSCTEVLVCMAEGDATIEQALRDAHGRIFNIAETAMRSVLQGQARAGVQLLIQQGGETRNPKLIDMAALVLRRYNDKIDDPDPLAQQIQQLQQRYVRSQGLRTARATGGLVLRA
ncbi:response regulator [Roseateles sp. BYS180W]|uniref:Response regulator n=1 Tax=Roseateles rivi TaxID=3299028 RepID=A0ABW7FVP8_9BURK